MFGQKGVDKSLLRDVDSQVARSVVCPMVVAAEEPGDWAHEFDAKARLDRSFQPFFNVIGFTVINKIVNVKTHVDGWVIGKGLAYVDTRFMRQWLHADGTEGTGKCLVPVARAAPEAVESLVELPVSIRLRKGAAFWRAYNDHFVGW